MTKTPQDRLLEWARDAHAMEEQAETMLGSLASRIENYPTLKRRIEEHQQETRRQAEALKKEIDRLGGGTSALKDYAAKAVALGQGMSGMFVSDEIVKGLLASYTFEHFEIASYRALIATAEVCGDQQIKSVCETERRGGDGPVVIGSSPSDHGGVPPARRGARSHRQALRAGLSGRRPGVLA